MSNVRGIVKFEADGATHSLQFSTNALVSLEEALGVSVSEVGDKLSGAEGRPVALKDLRTLFRCGLIEHWPSGEPTDKQAGSMIDAVGGIGPAAELVGKAFAAAFPDAVELPPEPAKAKAGNAPKK